MESRKNAKEINDAIETIAKQMKKTLQYSLSDFDRTFISIVQKKNSDGTYEVIDSYGTIRNVVLGLPNVTLSIGQRVYVTIPCNQLKNMYISGVHPQIINR